MATKATIGLHDSDILVYTEAVVREKVYDWDSDGTKDQLAEPLDNVTRACDDRINEYESRLKLTRSIVCLSCASADNFRKDFYPPYKENRANVVRPLHLAAAKGYLASNYETYERPRLEADDVMGILSTHPSLLKGRKIIISSDKDMKTIPGWLWNPDKNTRAYKVNEIDAFKYFMKQTLMGDAVDGYPGAYRVGDKRSDEVLEGCPDEYWEPDKRWAIWEDAIVPTYMRAHRRRAGFTTGLARDDDYAGVLKASCDEALSQARCARILHYTDYDFKNKEVIPWTPK